MERFWADDLDMDLLKVFPGFAEELGETGRTAVWTLGHTSFGRLNHPSVWHTHGAFLWLQRPQLERSSTGWTDVRGCVTDSPIVECTWLEWLRDCWVHQFDFVMLPVGGWFVCFRQHKFDTIMWRTRGWDKDQVGAEEHEQAARQDCLVWMRVVTERFIAARAEIGLAAEVAA